MKDSLRKLADFGLALTLSTALVATGGCRKSSKTADVAQDSLLVRARGTATQPPSLTSGAPVKRSGSTVQMQPPTSPTYNPIMPQPKMQPPAGVHPVPVLPGRDSTRKDSSRDSVSTSL